ncbi:hypothetical protein MNBD_GAMMA09-1572, partial [hydrothermal vent metagenome]
NADMGSGSGNDKTEVAAQVASVWLQIKVKNVSLQM